MASLASAALFWLTACGDPKVEEPPLSIEGNDHVRVEALGPVHAPKVLRGDGSEATGLTWTAADPAVAGVNDGGVVAVGPGETRITGTLGDDVVAWTLLVDPAMQLAFVDPPATMPVGATAKLALRATVGETAHEPGQLEWKTSSEGVLTVTDGEIKGVAPGKAWITVSSGGSQAMAEITVVAAAQ